MPVDAWRRPKRGSAAAKNHSFMDTYFPSDVSASNTDYQASRVKPHRSRYAGPLACPAHGAAKSGNDPRCRHCGLPLIQPETQGHPQPQAGGHRQHGSQAQSRPQSQSGSKPGSKSNHAPSPSVKNVERAARLSSMREERQHETPNTRPQADVYRRENPPSYEVSPLNSFDMRQWAQGGKYYTSQSSVSSLSRHSSRHSSRHGSQK